MTVDGPVIIKQKELIKGISLDTSLPLFHLNLKSVQRKKTLSFLSSFSLL